MFPRRKRGEISLTYMSGPLDGKTLMFEQPETGQQRVIIMGRRETCDIHLAFDNQASREHARIICESKPVTSSDATSAPLLLSFWLEDLDSRNGTFLEKQERRIEKRVLLQPGTLFRVGRTWLRLDVPLSFGG